MFFVCECTSTMYLRPLLSFELSKRQVLMLLLGSWSWTSPLLCSRRGHPSASACKGCGTLLQ